MVLTAIERMESHHSTPRDASSRSSLKFRSPENARTGNCGCARENGVTASTSTLRRKRDEQQPVPKSKSAEELSRLSSVDAGASVVSRDKGSEAEAEADGESSSTCEPEPIKGVEDRVEKGLPGAVTPALVRNGSDENSGTRRKEDLSSRSCASVSRGLFSAADPADGHINRPGTHDPDGRSVGNRPQEDGRREQRVWCKERAESKMDENRLGNGCGSNLTDSTSSIVAEVDNPEPQKDSSEEQRISIDVSTTTETANCGRDNEERNAEDSRTSTSTGAPKDVRFSRENAVKETDSGSLSAPGVPQTRPNGSRLNPRATPFTFHPGASVFPATSRPTPGREGETRCPNSPISKATPNIAKGAATSPRQIQPSTVSSTTTAAIGVASATANTEMDTGGKKSGGGGLAPRAEHDLLPLPPSPPKEPRNGFASGSEPPPPATFGDNLSCPSMDVGVETAITAAGAASGESKHVNGEASMTVCEAEGARSREAKGKHASDGVSTAPAYLPVREAGSKGVKRLIKL